MRQSLRHKDVLCEEIVLEAVPMCPSKEDLPMSNEPFVFCGGQLSGLRKFTVSNQEMSSVCEFIRAVPDDGAEAFARSLSQCRVPVVDIPENRLIGVGIALEVATEGERLFA